jgi:hypothetical protein
MNGASVGKLLLEQVYHVTAVEWDSPGLETWSRHLPVCSFVPSDFRVFFPSSNTLLRTRTVMPHNVAVVLESITFHQDRTMGWPSRAAAWGAAVYWLRLFIHICIK